MLQTINWHENCLKNTLVSLNETKSKLDYLIDKYSRDKKSFEFYQLQIQEAKKFGKTSFDPEKFMSKHRK